MCDFVSWIEYKKKVYFLTGKQIFETPRGDAFRAYTQSKDDYAGHGAIRWFFELDGKGTQKECTDFSDPKNFPIVIVRAIKRGEMRGLGTPKGLLTAPAEAEYQKVTAPAWAEYQKVTAPAEAEYEKVRAAAWAEYQKVTAAAWAEYEKVRVAAWAEYEKVRAAAWAEYRKVRADTFWDLFANPQNRAEAWK